jgi:hypothetical protein
MVNVAYEKLTSLLKHIEGAYAPERVNLKWTVCFKLIVNFLEPPEALGS